MLNVHACTMEECRNAGNFLQSPFWAAFKGLFGWETCFFLMEFAGEVPSKTVLAIPLVVLSRPLVRGFSFAYIPWGPDLPSAVLSGETDDSLALLLNSLAAQLRGHLPPDTAFLRVDLPWAVENGNTPFAAGKPWKRAGADVQPPDTVLLNLEPEADAILAQMKNKWRYNVRLGCKKVAVRLAARSADFLANDCICSACAAAGADFTALELFYALLCETAARDGIVVHSFDYYKKLFVLAGNYPYDSVDIRLYLAEFEGKAIAGIITLFRKQEAVYLYGASSSARRELMAPYALQWQAVLDAKAAGALTYDFFGIPPDSNPKHPMAGLYRFKTGFGGRIMHRPGSYDYAYKPFLYAFFSFAEKLRKRLRNLKKRGKKSRSKLSSGSAD